MCFLKYFTSFTIRYMHHWADTYAEQLLKRKPNQTQYVCASGITPSGIVHFGNFREFITIEIVVRALRDRGVQVRHIHIWDDFDALRKIPPHVPESYHTHLRKPLDAVPSPVEGYPSYAAAHEHPVEKILQTLGIDPEYINQSTEYRNARYAALIRLALEKRDELRAILDTQRTTPLAKDWWPVAVYSEFDEKDATTIVDWDGQWTLRYHCHTADREYTIADIRKTDRVKLLWRIDWPMRWRYFAVDMEASGKDHFSKGGSFDTGCAIAKSVFEREGPFGFQFDFIGIKGLGGKMSSSQGLVIAIEDVLKVYQPELIRYLFVRSRPNSEFAVSFDLDTLKSYEDYDRSARYACGVDSCSEERRKKERRIWELSQIDEIPNELPYTIPFRHLCNLLQIYDYDVDALFRHLNLDAKKHRFLEARMHCAIHWLREHAPKEFIFAIRHLQDPVSSLAEEITTGVAAFARMLEQEADEPAEKRYTELLRIISENCDISVKQLCVGLYNYLITRDQGPRLAGFMVLLGKERILSLLEE